MEVVGVLNYVIDRVLRLAWVVECHAPLVMPTFLMCVHCSAVPPCSLSEGGFACRPTSLHSQRKV